MPSFPAFLSDLSSFTPTNAQMRQAQDVARYIRKKTKRQEDTTKKTKSTMAETDMQEQSSMFQNDDDFGKDKRPLKKQRTCSEASNDQNSAFSLSP